MTASGITRRELVRRGGLLALPVFLRTWFAVAGLLLAAGGAMAAPKYDLLLQGGHVIDPKSGTSAVRDVAIAGGKIAAILPRIDPAEAVKVVEVSGLYVTPGLVDMHAHVYAGTGEKGSYAGDNSVYPDGFTLRVGVTTVVDAGCSGWRSFADFKDRIIDRSRTRVLAFLNIVGNGMRGGKYEQDLADMEAKPTAETVLRHKGLVVGIKTAHYEGPDWTAVERSVEAGTMASVPVMVDFGANKPERPITELLRTKLRPGDIYTHCYSGLRGELEESGRLNPGMWEGRKRGVLFDVGHGGGSFAWYVAVPAIKEGFLPDTISTDLHIGSMNEGMKDQLNVMSKFLALGLSLEDVIARSTWNPARAIQREDLGHLSIGATADVTVLSLQSGRFGFVDSFGGRMRADKKLVCELTLRDGRILYDLNGLARPDWDTLKTGYRTTGDPRWDGYHHHHGLQVDDVERRAAGDGAPAALPGDVEEVGRGHDRRAARSARTSSASREP
jgi:dihydroorotase